MPEVLSGEYHLPRNMFTVTKMLPLRGFHAPPFVLLTTRRMATKPQLHMLPRYPPEEDPSALCSWRREHPKSAFRGVLPPEGGQYRGIVSVLYVGEGQYCSIGCGIAS